MRTLRALLLVTAVATELVFAFRPAEEPTARLIEICVRPRAGRSAPAACARPELARQP